MKKGAQITFLIASLLWFVSQICNFIYQFIINVNIPNPDGLSKNYGFMVNLLIDNIPEFFFSATICIVFIADLAHKVLKHKKILYIISAVLFLPTIIQGSYNLLNTLLYKNQFYKSDLQTFAILGIDFFTILLWILVFVYLVAMVLQRDKLKKIIVPVFVISIFANLAATLLQYFSPVFKITDLWYFLLITLLIFIMLFLAIYGFMLRGIKVPSKTEEIAQPV